MVTWLTPAGTVKLSTAPVKEKVQITGLMREHDPDAAAGPAEASKPTPTVATAVNSSAQTRAATTRPTTRQTEPFENKLTPNRQKCQSRPSPMPPHERSALEAVPCYGTASYCENYR